MIFGRIKLYLAAAGAFAVALFAAYFRGRSDKAEVVERERLEGYVETRKRMDEAGRMSDAAAARELLRERNK